MQFAAKTTQATSIKGTTEIPNGNVCGYNGKCQVSSIAQQKQPEMAGQFMKQKQTNS